MGEACHIGKDELLALDIDVIDIVAIYDQAPTNPDELEAFRAKLFTYHTLHLSELERQHPSLVVSLNEVAVVPVRRDKHNPLGSDAPQVGGG